MVAEAREHFEPAQLGARAVSGDDIPYDNTKSLNRSYYLIMPAQVHVITTCHLEEMVKHHAAQMDSNSEKNPKSLAMVGYL